MSRSNGTRADIANWGSETIRFTLFHANDRVLDEDGLWKNLVGEESESINKKPKTKERMETGKYEDCQLIFLSNGQNGRIDWVLQTPPDKEKELPKYTDRSVLLHGLMKKWISKEKLSRPLRIAYGIEVVLKMTDMKTALAMLSNYMSFDLDKSITGDFVYQCNRRRKSNSITGLEINRLCKWCISETTFVSLQVTPEGMKQTAKPESLGLSYRIEMDINTVVDENVPLKQEYLLQLLDDLVGMASEIIVEGDIP